MLKEEVVESRPRSKAKAVLLGLLVLFFVMVAFLVFSIARLVNTVNDGATSAMEPIGDRMRSLFLPATPVILPNPATVVKQINDLARLETASYEMEKIVTADSDQEGIMRVFLGESMIFVAYGKVYAGVDFARMQAADMVVVSPDTVKIHLPPAEIFADIPVLDNERSFVADRDTGLLTPADPALETQVRQAAEQSIREAAQSSDILQRADLNAQAYMRNFMAGLGFTEVIFTPDTPPATDAYQQVAPKGYYLLPTATPTAP